MYAGQRVVVFGLGRSGQAAVDLALSLGADVVGVDQRRTVPRREGVRYELGPHRRETFLEADLIVVSPGIPAKQADLVAAREAGVEVVGELGFAARHITAPILAVTGTNGKSTVVSYTGQIFAHAGVSAFVGGNLGTPLSEEALSGDHDICVVEVSSYQMELPGSFTPIGGVILNLTPDHLARHGDMEGYGRAKCRLFSRLSGSAWAVIPRGDERLSRLADEVGTGRRAWLGGLPGVRVRGREATVELGETRAVFDLSALRVEGAHNLEHAGTAAMLALMGGVSPEAVSAALPTLTALPHRMEPVAERRGVMWINDSKATNVASTTVAVAGLGRRAVVLLGGRAKGPGFGALAPGLSRHVAVLAFGEASHLIATELSAQGIAVERFDSMHAAMVHAASIASEGEAVLLSPACSSFDAFTNFEHRGEVFRDFVLKEVP